MIRKIQKKPAKSVEDVVVRALTSSQYKYRTVKGVARDAHLDEKRVRTILESSPAVRKSFAKSKSGVQLYAAKAKVSGAADLWTAFRAVNSAKFGG